LLFGRTALSFASLGAIVTVLGLAVDPFVQQVVGTAEKVSFVPSDDVWTERLTRPSFFPDLLEDDDLDYYGILNSAIWTDARLYDRLEFCVDTGIVQDPSSLEWDCSASLDDPAVEGVWKDFNETGEPQSTTFPCTIYFSPNKSDALRFEGYYVVSGAFTEPGQVGVDFPTSHIGYLELDDMTGSASPALIQTRTPLSALGLARFSIPGNGIDFRHVKLERAEWATLTFCNTTRSVSVVNGSTSAALGATGPQFGITHHPASMPTFEYPFSCWAPNEAGIVNPPMDLVMTSQYFNVNYGRRCCNDLLRDQICLEPRPRVPSAGSAHPSYDQDLDGRGSNRRYILLQRYWDNHRGHTQ